jgi:hypothetical protein
MSDETVTIETTDPEVVDILIEGGGVGEWNDLEGTADKVPFTTTNGGPTATGELAWLAATESLALRLMNGENLDIGEETIYHVENNTGSTIGKGVAVSYAGTTGASGKLRVKPWDGTVDAPESFMGFAMGSITNGATGYVTGFGVIRGINTAGFSDGVILYANPAGTGVTATKPTGTHVVAAVCINAGNNGAILVRPTIAGYVETTDARLSDAREWTASTVTQSEAEAGASTTRRAWTAQRVFQAIAAWWNGSSAKTKLDGIAIGATANQTDAFLLSRANHTGTQTASTISNFNAAVAATPPASHTHGSITNDGRIGITGDLVVVTGTGGALTVASRSGIDSRASFPNADVTAATSAAVANTLVRRGDDGEVTFGSSAAFSGTAVNCYSNLGIALQATSVSGSGVATSSDSGNGIETLSISGVGLQSYSVSGIASVTVTQTGTNHAYFGDSGNDRSFIRRVLGLIGWHRGSFTQTLGSPATLTANRAVTLPDADGTLLISGGALGTPSSGNLANCTGLPAAGVTGLGTLATQNGTFSGTSSGTNTGDETGARIAALINAATEDTAIVDADQIPLTETAASGAFRRATFATVWAWITGKLAALTSLTVGGAWNFSSTTRPTSSGTGTPAANSLITRGDDVWEYAENAFCPLSWNTPTATANASFAIGGSSLRLTLAATAVAGNNSLATVFSNPLARGGSGANMRINGARFSFLLDIYVNGFSNSEIRFLMGVGTGAVDISSAAGLGVRWTSVSTVALQINNGALVESAPLAISNFDFSRLNRFLVTWDGTTLRLYQKNWVDSAAAPRWSLIGSHTTGTIPSTGSGTSINLTHIATGQSPNITAILHSCQFAPYAATPL